MGGRSRCVGHPPSRVCGDRTREWMLWHMLEHELMHAGELSRGLGSHGLDTIRPI